MTLKDSITSDVSAVFLQLNDFAETITYSFRAGGNRTLPAIVERNPPAVYDAAGNVVMPAISIDIADAYTNGVLRSEVDTGGDSVELLAENGDTAPTTYTVLHVGEADIKGMLTLSLK